jgi:predicted amidohydrolase
VETSTHVAVGVGQIASGQDTHENLERIIATFEAASAKGVQLLVLPECALSGYMYEDRDTALARAVTKDSPEIEAMAAACARLGLHAVVGYLETDETRSLYNTAAFIDDRGIVIANYRKTHLPCLGVDRFVDAGDTAPPVVPTRLGNIGLAICYDLRFPESARSLALLGADIIAQPSTWPYEAAMLAEHFVPVRACENRVFMLVANRSDSERGAKFIGRSQIVAPSGRRLGEAGEDGEALLTARIDLDEARDKRIVTVPGEYEISLFDDRRPELYQVLAHHRG